MPGSRFSPDQESAPEQEEKIPQLTQAVHQVHKLMKSAPYVKAMGSKKQDLFVDLKNIFTLNKIPLGLTVSLVKLKKYAFHFKIDDSGSMTFNSTLTRVNASPYMKTESYVSKDQDMKIESYVSKDQLILTRWQEAENRLHIMIDLLGLIPISKITLSFLNSSTIMVLDRIKQDYIQFATEAHRLVRTLFVEIEPQGGTPIIANMRKMFAMAEEAKEDTMLYLFTDGQPDNNLIEKQEIETLLLTRAHAKKHPFTFLGCSEHALDHQWMNKIALAAQGQYVAAIPNFEFQKDEVGKCHGSQYSYDRGYWLLSNLVAARDPHYLGALTQPIPLTKPAMQRISGLVCSDSHYRSYFNAHPKKDLFQEDYPLFLTTEKANEISTVKQFQIGLATGHRVVSGQLKQRDQQTPLSRKNIHSEIHAKKTQTSPSQATPNPSENKCVLM